MNLEDWANIATIISLLMSVFSLIISGVTIRKVIKIENNNNLQNSSVNNSTINQIKG